MVHNCFARLTWDSTSMKSIAEGVRKLTNKRCAYRREPVDSFSERKEYDTHGLYFPSFWHRAVDRCHQLAHFCSHARICVESDMTSTANVDQKSNQPHRSFLRRRYRTQGPSYIRNDSTHRKAPFDTCYTKTGEK